MLQSKLLSQFAGVEHGFLIRSTNTSIRESMESRISLAKQVHGSRVLWFHKFEQKERAGDALATLEKGLLVGAQSADCTPILVLALGPKKNPVAAMAVHAGWRGAAAGIARHSLQEFVKKVRERVPLERLVMAIGPCISRDAFEVESDVVEAFPHVKPEPKGMVNGRQKFFFNLEAENARQLTAECQELNIKFDLERFEMCTVSDPEQFPSYRRDGGTGERIISFIGLAK